MKWIKSPNCVRRRQYELVQFEDFEKLKHMVIQGRGATPEIQLILKSL